MYADCFIKVNETDSFLAEHHPNRSIRRVVVVMMMMMMMLS
jgi:hypothetical protein